MMKKAIQCAACLVVALSAMALTPMTLLAQYYPGGLDTAGLELWLDAADTATVLEAVADPAEHGDRVYEWSDKSPANRDATQADATRRPIFLTNVQNGRSVLQGNNFEWMGFSNISIAAGADVTVVGTVTAENSLPSDGFWLGNNLPDVGTTYPLKIGRWDAARPRLTRLIDYTTDISYSPWLWGNSVAVHSIWRGTGDLVSVTTNSSTLQTGTRTGPTLINRLSPQLAADNQKWDGYWNEILIYTRAISATERYIIENYKAAKWGFTLDANTKYTDPVAGIGGFDNELVGIGRESITDNVTSTTYTAGLGFSSGTAAGDFLATDGNYLAAAHDGQAANTTPITIGAANAERFTRVWYVQKTGTLTGAVTIFFDFGDYAGSPVAGANYYLLQNTAADFSGTTSIVSENSTIVGDRLQFTVDAGDIANGYFTLASSAASESRRALDFDGIDDFVEIAHDAPLNLGATGSLEAWIYMFGTVNGAGIIHKGDGATGESYSLRLGGTNNDQIQLVVNDGTTTDTVLSTTSILTNTWYHLAGTWDNTTNSMAIYINGVQDNTASCNRSAVNSSEKLIIGAVDDTGSNSFNGVIDEVRVWSDILTVNVLRDWMCKKLIYDDQPTVTGHPYWGTTLDNLEGNWRFDEDSGFTCADESGNSINGTIGGAARVCSEAPIGDESAHDYVGAGGFTASILSISNDQQLTATEFDGTWGADSGIQVYRVAVPPDYIAGPPGWQLLDSAGHWGVFVTGGTSPTYTVEYNYDVTDDGLVGISDENALRLAFREHNCQPWKDVVADLDTGLNTLTREGLSGTEFILGKNVDPRNAIDFDGTNDFVNCGNPAGIFDITGDITIEAWVNPDAWSGNYSTIVAKRASFGNMDWELFRYNNPINEIQFWYRSGGVLQQLFVGDGIDLALGIWQHVAITNEDAVWSFYVNGVLQTGTPDINSNDLDTGDPLIIGLLDLSAPNVNNCFDGKIDEVRIWNVARTQDEIRDTMCKKITSSDAGWANLVGYWRFDEETNSVTCPDYSANNNAGTMTNFGTNPVGAGLDPIREHRVCSSAPIGDDSAYGYHDPAGPAVTPVTATLAHSDGDFMTVTENAGGTWTDLFSGIHIYRLDEASVYPPDLWDDAYYTYTTPNGLTPPAGPPAWSSIDYYRYWGVFVTDPVNDPPFDVVYTYTGNPSVPVNDNQLGLARRPEYCFGTWTDSGATLNPGADTLTLLGDSQSATPRENPEYVLGGINDPLAIVLAAFTARVKDGCVEILWETATEIDTVGFQLWRSTEKDGPYEPVSGGFIPSNSQMETMGASYDYTDCDVETGGKTEYYYKLEEIDMDSGKDNAFYGPIGPVREGLTASQTAPKTRSGDDGACFIGALQ